MVAIKTEESAFSARDGTDLKYFMAWPDDSARHPSIIVVQEIWGLTPFIKDVCRELAEHGFVAIGPHLYSRKDLVDILTEENIMDTMRHFWSIPPEKRQDQAAMSEIMSKFNDVQRKVANLLLTQRDALSNYFLSCIEDTYNFIQKRNNHQRIGITGFCMGGGLAFQASTMLTFDSSVIFYGANPKPIDSISKIKGEVLGIYAGEDSNINDGLPELIAGVVRNHVKFQLNIYPGTQHAFFNHTGMSYNKPAADDAWERMLTFFDRHLGE